MSQPYQTDLLLVAVWQLLQMEISVQKGWQTLSGAQNLIFMAK